MVETVIMLCGHCGNRAPLEQCYQYSQEETDPDYPHYWAKFTYTLFKCQTCSSPTLKRTCISSEDTELDPFFPLKILYPPESRVLDNIPFEIGKTYKEALKVRTVSPRSCSVMIGLTLEAICNHENASGNTLANKIDSLIRSNRIPPALAEMVDQLRKLRNLGAHDATDLVTAQDIPLMLDLLEAILEYLYVAPTKLKALKDKLEHIS